MARDKLITIRIEGEKREAFNNLAKSQNTDTASLLYDFISQCLDGGIDISLVTGKGNRLDKLDNRIDSNRIDKLETDTQEIDNRLDTIAKKLTDWIEAFDNRLSDCCERHSSIWISTLSSQLDSQQLDSIDTDRQRDRQGETPDMGTVATVETVEAVDDNVESDSIDEPVTGSIGPVRGEGDSIEPGEGMTAKDAAKYLKTKRVTVSYDSLNRWINNEKIPDSPQGKDVRKHLTLRDKLYYPIN